MKVTITKIFTTDKDKQGNPLKSKKGAPYTRMSIKTAEHGDKWVSGFQNADNKGWKEGDTVEVNIKENGEYLNFETPKKEDEVMAELLKIKTMMARMGLDIQIIKESVAPKGRTSPSEDFPNGIDMNNHPLSEEYVPEEPDLDDF